VKPIVIVGSTGSIGTQTLDIVASHPEEFRVVGLSAGRNIERLAQQIRQFRPQIAATCYPERLDDLRAAVADLDDPPNW